MSENAELSDKTFWKDKLREHWKTLVVVIAAGICALLGILLVLIWFIDSSPIGGQGSWTFNEWTLIYVVGFMILIILWELLFVGVPASLFYGIGGYLWWRRLPEEEKQEFRDREKRAKNHKRERWGGGGGFGFFMFISYCIYIAVDGNYNARFGTQPYTYWLSSYLLTFMWIVIIFGVPVAIIVLILYFTKWRKK
ncbi:MAG: hypothetical protein ACFFG0_51825 [Candidatus Thorarchaeota archaeon]